jgi:hypothetical protein
MQVRLSSHRDDETYAKWPDTWTHAFNHLRFKDA